MSARESPRFYRGEVFNPAGAKASMESLKKHQQEIAKQKSQKANNASRAIVKMVEAETGKEISLECCMRIVAAVYEAQ